MSPMTRDGWIEVICGGMFSGKSEELIRRIRRARIARQKVAVFKPTVDTRYHPGTVTSHNGVCTEAVVVENAAEILGRVPDEIDVVAMDEVQFFEGGLVQVAQTLADRGIRVICAGLDQDFRGEPFGPTPVLMAVAEYVTKLQAICVRCGAPAGRSQRLIDGSPVGTEASVIQVGGKEQYEARCRHCHQITARKSLPKSFSPS